MDSGDRVEGTPMVTERTCSGNGLLTTVTNCSFPTAHDRSTYFHYFTAGGGGNGCSKTYPRKLPVGSSIDFRRDSTKKLRVINAAWIAFKTFKF